MSETHKWAWYDFRLEASAHKTRCSECPRKIEAGELAWVSRGVTGKGKIGKRVCSEECGRNFDYRMMREQARRREHGELGRP